MKKSALLILANGFEEVEAVAPIDMLRRAGIDVMIAGLGQAHVISARGMSIQADTELSRYAGSPDALILPGGGGGAKKLHESPLVAQWVTNMNKQGKLIAAICASPAVVLAPLGILNGGRATCFRDMQHLFGTRATHVDAPVVVWKNIITSAGPGTSFEFAMAIITYLIDKITAENIAYQAMYPGLKAG